MFRRDSYYNSVPTPSFFLNLHPTLYPKGHGRGALLKRVNTKRFKRRCAYIRVSGGPRGNRNTRICNSPWPASRTGSSPCFISFPFLSNILSQHVPSTQGFLFTRKTKQGVLLLLPICLEHPLLVFFILIMQISVQTLHRHRINPLCIFINAILQTVCLVHYCITLI